MARYFISTLSTRELPSSPLALARSASHNTFKGMLAEAIVFGENTVVHIRHGSISTLIDWLGLHLFRDLCESKQLTFSFSAPVISAYLTQENVQQLGHPPDGTGLTYLEGHNHGLSTIRGRVGRDLSANTSLKRADRREVCRIVERLTTHVDSDLFSLAHDAARTDVGGTVGSEYSFRHVGDPDDGLLAEIDRRIYLAIATANENVAIASFMGCDCLVSDRLTDRVLRQRIVGDSDPQLRTLDGLRLLLRVQSVPDFGRMLEAGSVTFEDLARLGRSDEAARFRQWLQYLRPTDEFDAVRQYQDDLVSRLNVQTPFRSVEAVMYTVMTSMLTMPIDPIIGIALGVGHGVNQAVQSARKTWHPKIFLESLSDSVSERIN